MGFCTKRGIMIWGAEEGKGCSAFHEKTEEFILDSLREKGWVYCSECMETLTEEPEVADHMRMGHRIFAEVFSDDSISEEAHAGD